MTIEERVKNTIQMLNYVSSVEKPDGDEWRQILAAIIQAARQDGIEEENEACAQLMDREAEGFQVLIDHAPTPIRAEDLKRVKHSIETVAKQIRARSEKGE